MIRFECVSKRFLLPQEARPAVNTNFFERLRRRRDRIEEFWALRDISFEIAQGESVGVLGANGSGKSTILKLIVQILHPTHGHVTTHGRVAALLELGAGFHSDLSGRDNIYLNGSLLGLSKREIDRIFDSVVDFAELDQFIDTPVKHYSSGMYMRLGFSIAVHSLPDILLIDETLAVGDQAFQAKCLTRIHEIKKLGTTIMLVSHSSDAVRELCERGMWVEHGSLRSDGPVDDVISAYLGAVLKKEREDIREAEPLFAQVNSVSKETSLDAQEVEIERVEFLDSGEKPRQDFVTGEGLVARIHYHAFRKIQRPTFGVAIYGANGVHINGPNTELSEHKIDFIDGVGFVDYTIPVLPLLSGNYLFSAAIYDQEGIHAYDHHHARYRFTVLPGGTKERFGMFCIPSIWTHERCNGIASNGNSHN